MKQTYNSAWHSQPKPESKLQGLVTTVVILVAALSVLFI
jgi:hypothetical protein